MAVFVVWQRHGWPAGDSSWLRGSAATLICWVTGNAKDLRQP